jgi:hypothetical protein
MQPQELGQNLIWRTLNRHFYHTSNIHAYLQFLFEVFFSHKNTCAIRPKVYLETDIYKDLKIKVHEIYI